MHGYDPGGDIEGTAFSLLGHSSEPGADSHQLGESAIFWVPSMVGPVMVAPRKYLAEIKNHPDLSLADYVSHGFGGAQTRIDDLVWSQSSKSVFFEELNNPNSAQKILFRRRRE